MENLTSNANEKPVDNEAGIFEAKYELQKESILIPMRRYTGALLIYPIYWITTWGAFTRVVGATLSSKKAQEQVERGIIDSVWEYGWGDHYICFLIVFCLVTYCCAVLAGATAKKRGSIIASIANLPVIVFLSLFYFWLHMSQTEIEISMSWKFVLPVAVLGSVFFSAIGGSAGQRWQVNSFGNNTILGIRPIHWWWFIFPISLAIQTLVPKIVAAFGLLLGSTLVMETKYSVMLFLIFVALATFAYFILWGWYKTLHLLSISHNADLGRCGIALRVLFFLFGIPILGELFFVLIFLLLGGFS